MEMTGDLLLMFGAGPARQETTAACDVAAERNAGLVARARSGDGEAFGQLYDLYGAMVHGILLARVPPGEVEDLLQDVFLSAFRRLNTLRDDTAFGGWIAMMARNRAMDFFRRRKETAELSEHLPQRHAPQAEAKEALAIIRRLPEAYRETLVLRLVEGMSGPEIAARTGLTPASVRVNLHRGMKLLRERMGL
jgi:RNA polymerase sigma-70 factor (ECF subfamily)